jgi:hypothetical protein
LSKFFPRRKEKELSLKKQMSINNIKIDFYFLSFKMVIKKTETKTLRTKAGTKTATSTVVKTTKPKVVVQTKNLNEPLPFTVAKVADTHHHHKGGRIWKILILLVVLANLIVSSCSYQIIKEQQAFTISSNGGAENYQMLKNLYESPSFQQASTLSIYQLVERVDQTLAAAQNQDNTSAQNQGEVNPSL